jgi:ribose-phosphate pyrophosphokinase
MIVVPGPSSQSLGEKIASELDVDAYTLEWRLFPDGESYIRYPKGFDGEDVILVQSCPPPTDRNLMQLFLMADGAKNAGARKVSAVIPYLAYMRQDKAFRPGDVVCIRTVAKLIESVNIEKLVTIDVHSHESITPFKIPVTDISAMPSIAQYIGNLSLKNPIVFAPDKGARDRANVVAEYLHSSCEILDKVRDRVTGQVKIAKKELDLVNRDVVIIDDIISTGGTIIEAAELALSQKARRVYVACTHALMMGDAKENIKRSGVYQLIGTDTVENENSIVSVAPAVASIFR